MKICHVTSSHQRYDGRIFQKECTSLAKKYDVILLCSDTNPDEIKNNVKIKSIGISNKSRKNRFFVIPRKFRYKVIEIDADVYHLHDPELMFLAGYLKKKKKKVIFDSHEDNVNRIDDRSWIPNFFKPVVKKIYEKKEKKVLRKIDAVITVTDYIHDRLSKVNRNTYIITNYPLLKNIDSFKKKDNNILCFAGGVEKKYMHHNIIQAMDGLDVKYYIAGLCPNNYYEELEKLPNFSKVKYLGLISKEECNELYINSNIGMVLVDYVPNINYKKGSLGITKIFEYMEYGLPVIATNLEVWRDIVPNKCGICVNPNNISQIHDAIEYLINHPKEAKKMGEKGQKLVREKYNWDTQEKILYSIYEKLK